MKTFKEDYFLKRYKNNIQFIRKEDNFINKSIPNERSADGLADRAESSWNLARKITESMEE